MIALGCTDELRMNPSVAGLCLPSCPGSVTETLSTESGLGLGMGARLRLLKSIFTVFLLCGLIFTACLVKYVYVSCALTYRAHFCNGYHLTGNAGMGY